MTDPIRHIVRQFNWLRAGAVFVRAPGERRIAWFETVDEAVANQRHLEQLVREKYNPFAFGTGWYYLTTLPLYAYRDWLLDESITPPVGEALAEWRAWWDAVRAELRPGQQDRVWDGLTRLRFHDVIARRSSETVYCISRILWDYDDGWYHAGHEGGEPLKLFRTREPAEQERERLELAVRADGRVWGYFPRDPERFLDDPDSWSQIDRNAPHFEVIEVDLPEGVS